MNWKPSRRAGITVIIGVVAVIVSIHVWLLLGRGDMGSRTYVIGWASDPPFQLPDANGEPTGLAIELVREAALRRGIRLKWVTQPEGPDRALREGAVDLWPLITISPDRMKYFHITDPYLVSENCLLVLAASAYRKEADLENATVSYSDMPIIRRQVHGHLPGARLVARPSAKEVVEDVCRKRADAAFLDQYTVDYTLLGGAGCADQPLRLISLSGSRPQLGVGATFQARAAADAIRDEIRGMAEDGALSRIFLEWGFVSQGTRESVELLTRAKRREPWLLVAMGMVASLSGLALWQALRIRRQTIRAKQAQQALGESEQKLRLMAGNLKEMVLAYDMNRRLIYANPGVEFLTGYSIAELETEGFICWVHPDDRERMLGHWDELFEGGSFQDEEYRLITKDGRVKWATASWGPILDPDGRQIGVQGSERDITERKQAEEALRESERRFRGLLESVQLAAVMCDLRGNVTFANDYLLTATGWTLDEFLGRPATESVAPEHRDRIAQVVDLALRPGMPFQFYESAVLTKDGARRWIEWNATTLYDPAGDIAGFASLGVDVTDQRILHQQLLQAQKLESVGRLAGGVAHDFNNLLTVINGYSDIVLARLTERDPLRRHIGQIRKAGERAADLTQQLLAFSRKQVSQPRPLDLNRVVADSTPMFRSLVGDVVELVTRLDPELGQVMADPGQVHQVLMNLVANARDAMPAGGRLTIETANASADGNHAEALGDPTPESSVVLTVSDTGAGIDLETRRHLFEPFFTTKGEGRGVGLGLSTVYGIVQQCGGSIEVSSEPGHGATFRIALPRIVAGAVEDESDTPEPGQPRGTETILVVEDQDEVRGLTVEALKGLGYKVLEAAVGAEALALAESHPGPIHLVLTDVAMPRMNGVELAERLKAMRPRTRVLFMSGYLEEHALRGAGLEAAVEYLPKPFTPDALALKVREILGPRRSSRRNKTV